MIDGYHWGQCLETKKEKDSIGFSVELPCMRHEVWIDDGAFLRSDSIKLSKVVKISFVDVWLKTFTEIMLNFSSYVRTSEEEYGVVLVDVQIINIVNDTIF